MRILCAVILGAAVLLSPLSAQPVNGDWPVYNHDPAGTRYSPLVQINARNVAGMVLAFLYSVQTRISSNLSSTSSLVITRLVKPLIMDV